MNYKWIYSMAACYRGTLDECEKWAAKQVTERGWVRNVNILSHPNHGQVLSLVIDSSEMVIIDHVKLITTKPMNKIINEK